MLLQVIDYLCKGTIPLSPLSRERTDRIAMGAPLPQASETSLETLRPVEHDSLPVFPGENRRALERPFDTNRWNTDHQAKNKELFRKLLRGWAVHTNQLTGELRDRF